MALVQWQAELSVGVEILDQDHRNLFSMLNELYDAVQSGIELAVLTSLLDRLAQYTQDHFQREEALMKACGYPDIAAHCDEHEQLAVKVSELQRRLAGSSLEFLSLELLVLFKTWLASHIRVSDFQYKPYLVAWTRSHSETAPKA